MAAGYRNVAGVDADDLFDPDIVGDGPSAPGYAMVGGALLKYAAAKYGQPGATMGYGLVGGADIGPMWARKGTAQYSLPFDGQTYAKTYTIPPGGSGFAAIFFTLTSASAWQIAGSSTGGSGPVYLTGAVPASAASCAASFGPVTTPTGDAAGNATPSNNMSAPTALAAGLTAKLQTAVWSDTSGSHGSQANLTVTFYDASGSPISASTCLLMCRTDGSA